MPDRAATDRPSDADPTRPARLPRGRHHLSREEVTRSQRERILTGMATAMTEHGYVGTSVTEILRRASVSRQTFYEQFSSKEDCFAATFEWSVQNVMEQMVATAGTASDVAGAPVDPIDALLGTYLRSLALVPDFARVLLIETYAAGTTAIARRAAMQERFTDMVVGVLRARTEADRFACEVLVGGISTLVTARLAAGDEAGLLALQEPLAALGRRTAAAFDEQA